MHPHRLQIIIGWLCFSLVLYAGLAILAAGPTQQEWFALGASATGAGGIGVAVSFVIACARW